MESQVAPPPEFWAAIANVKETCHKGPGGTEEHNGTKHFRSGAKVYVIDAFWGMCDAVTVIGQHRKSRQFMCLHMPARHIENLRLKLVYSPAVLALMSEHYTSTGRSEPPGKEYAEQICTLVPRGCRRTPNLALQRTPHRRRASRGILAFSAVRVR